jgi:hypothetical protein
VVRRGHAGGGETTIDTARAGGLRASLAADGYQLEIAETAGRVSVTIIATPQACADCLVPKDLMRGILGQTLGVAAERIDLTYPREAQAGTGGSPEPPGQGAST